MAGPLEPHQTCKHIEAIPGLDAVYCPGCRTAFECYSTNYKELLNIFSQPENKTLLSVEFNEIPLET